MIFLLWVHDLQNNNTNMTGAFESPLLEKPINSVDQGQGFEYQLN